MAALEASPVAASLPAILAPVAATATVLVVFVPRTWNLGLGLAWLLLGFDLLGRRDDRALGDSFVIGGVDHSVARADGLTHHVEDAVIEFFLVAIANDLAACGRLYGSAFDLDGADCLAVRAHGKGEDCRRVSLSCDLTADNRDGRGRDALLGPGKDADVHAPMLGNDRATLVVAVVIGAVATGLDIAGYSLDNGVTNVDVTTRFVGVVVSGEDCGRELAFCERIHDRAVLDDDVVLVGEEGAGFIVPCTCTDRYGCAIERDALVDIDAIPNATCVEGSVRDREAVFTVDGGVFLGACLDLAATRDLDVAVGPNRIVFDRACLYLAAALYDEVLVSIDTLILGGLGGDGSAVVDRDVAVGPDAIRIARGVNVSRALMVTSPPASMASCSVLVALTVPAPSMLMLPTEVMASREDVTLSVLDASPEY